MLRKRKSRREEPADPQAPELAAPASEPDHERELADSVGIALLFQKETGTLWGVVMAGTLFVVLPVLVLFLAVQRHIVEGIAAGAVKG